MPRASGRNPADIYSPVAMPPALDRAVERCYRNEPFGSDRQRVEYLFALYEKLSAPLAVEGKKKRGGRKPSAPE